MNVHISISSRSTDIVLEEVMEYIRQTTQSSPQWKKHAIYNYYETKCDIPEEDILPALNALITKYPGVDLYASYSCDIREDDRSAQWWSTTTIKTEHHPDGTTTLSTDSSINWF